MFRGRVLTAVARRTPGECERKEGRKLSFMSCISVTYHPTSLTQSMQLTAARACRSSKTTQSTKLKLQIGIYIRRCMQVCPSQETPSIVADLLPFYASVFEIFTGLSVVLAFCILHSLLSVARTRFQGNSNVTVNQYPCSSCVWVCM